MKGKIICIDGSGDRIGKHTQATMLTDYINSLGVPAKCISFPNYGTPQAKPVEMYLAGEFPRLGPIEASMLYAFDRSVTLRQEKAVEFVNNGGCLILDRYVSSNAIYQIASSLKEGEEVSIGNSNNYFLSFKIEQLEYQIVGLPRPNITIYLDMDRGMNKTLLDEDTEKSGKDILESNEKLLDRVNIIGKQLANLCNWSIIKCNDDQRVFSKEEIHEKIKDTIADFALDRLTFHKKS